VHRTLSLSLRTVTFFLGLVFAFAAPSACVHPKFTSWRLVDNVLIPPGVSTPTATRVAVTVHAGRRSACLPDIRPRRKEVAVTMNRDHLSNQPRGWLATWAEDVEEKDCIAPGEALRLANTIVQSMPFEMNAAFRLLYPNDGKVIRLEPVFTCK
jgi:hypothetical protein